MDLKEDCTLADCEIQNNGWVRHALGKKDQAYLQLVVGVEFDNLEIGLSTQSYYERIVLKS